MTQREQKSMIAMKRMLDSYWDLPISLRAEIGNKLDTGLHGITNALYDYKSEVRQEVEQAIINSNINQRFK